MKRVFGRKESQFALRYKCLKLKKESGEDFDAYTAKVNLRVEKFDLENCTVEELKVLMFVQGLNEAEDSHTLEKLLSKLDEQEKKREAAAATDPPTIVPNLTFQEVNVIAARLGSLKAEKSMVMSPAPIADVMAVQQKPWSNRNTGPRSTF